MSTNPGMAKPFTATFVDAGPNVHLELTNTTVHRLRSVEVLTVFLKDEDTPGGGPSRAHIKFEPVSSIQPQEKVVMSHKTWIDGKPVDAQQDQLERLQAIVAEGKRYVLDISWEDPEGKSQFQRIPVGTQ